MGLAEYENELKSLAINEENCQQEINRIKKEIEETEYVKAEIKKSCSKFEKSVERKRGLNQGVENKTKAFMGYIRKLNTVLSGKEYFNVKENIEELTRQVSKTLNRLYEDLEYLYSELRKIQNKQITIKEEYEQLKIREGGE